MKTPDFRRDIVPMRDALQRAALNITHSVEEAEDAVQDTMLRVWAQRERWSEIGNMQAYCMTVCRNVALDKVKGRRAVMQPLDEGVQAQSREPSAHQQMEAADMRAAIEVAFQALPPMQQRIMELREQGELSYDEIADTLGISMSQVKVYLMRARNRIRKAITQHA